MTQVPINAITWSLGALALYTFAFKSWRSYRRTRNPLGRMYYVLGLAFGTALFFFGVPGLFTQDPAILRYTYFAADFFVQVSMQVQVWLLWFLAFRNHVRLRSLLLVTVPFSAILLTSEVLMSHVSISQSPYLVVYADQPLTLILKSIIYMSIAMPLGYFLIRQVPNQTTLQAKAKTFIGGMTFIVVGLAATSNNVFDKGSDTAQSATIVAVFFVVFFLIQLLRPPSRTTTLVKPY